MSTYVPCFAPVYPKLAMLGKLGLTATLYLIGSSISKPMLMKVGVRPMVQGVVLWAIVAISSLALIHFGLISI